MFLKENSPGTVVVEADSNAPDLRRRLQAVLGDSGSASFTTLLVCSETDRVLIESIRSAEFPQLRLICLPAEPGKHAAQLFSQITTEKVAFLRVAAAYTPPQWDVLDTNGSAFAIWVPDITIPAYSASAYSAPVRSWLASTDLVRGLNDLGAFSNWSLLHVADAAKRAGRSFRWLSPRTFSSGDTEPEPPAGNQVRLGFGSSVLALVPHYKCEQWLDQCLSSLVRQIRPLDGIVVIDDNSAQAPIEIVSKYPEVTLLQAAKNSGPYALSQQVINETDYDAYMFQDADDWAPDDRLKILLAEAERTGAEYIGSQLLRVLCDEGEAVSVCFPLDVSRAYAIKQSHPILHPTTLVAGDLVRRVSGYSTALRFGADSEFLRRVGFQALIINSNRFCYFQRHRKDSLTESPETGFGSAARLTLMENLKNWAEENRESLTSGSSIVKPYAMAGPVRLAHLLGPQLKPARQGLSPRT